jgi:hypothetical protein
MDGLVDKIRKEIYDLQQEMAGYVRESELILVDLQIIKLTDAMCLKLAELDTKQKNVKRKIINLQHELVGLITTV